VPRRRAVPALIATLAATGTAVSLLVPAAADPPNVPDPYFPEDGNVGYDVQHYDIGVAYDFGTGRLDGTTTVTLRALEDRDDFNLDLLLKVDAVEVDGEPVYFHKDGRHELVVEAPLAAGEDVDVEVTYHGFPGAVRWRGERNWRADEHEVITVNQPRMAPWWFPANDHPSDKATFEVAVTVDEAKQVIGNGIRTGRVDHGGTATTTWVMDAPMATYLAFFAAGDYVVRSGERAGIPYVNAASRHLPKPLRKDALRELRASAPVTAWLEDELGTYPYTGLGGTGGVVTGLPLGFALENQTRPVYGFIYRGVLVHELAHQWFGDAVAVEQWQDIWLNEGLATYMEVRYDEAHGGPSTKRWLRRTHRAYGQGDDFWRVRVFDPGRSSIFDDAVYVRGAMTMAALRNRIGKKDFRTLLRTWVTAHPDGNATTAEFVELAGEVSGEELHRFFDSWLVHKRRPAATASNGL
jgi:aminopeptidase N